MFSQDPGTTADPLISKSYLDQFFKFRSMVIPSGEKLPVQQGAVLVMRSGKARLQCPKGKSLLDLTDGKELVSGSFLPANHLLLVPDIGDYQIEAQAITMLLVQGLRPRK